MNKSVQFSLITTTIVVGSLSVGTWRAAADSYFQTDLVSDISGLAIVTDAALKNPWGLTNAPTSPFWVSDQVTNDTTLYAVTDSTNVSKVAPAGTNGNIAIPTTASGPQGPTGSVANTNTSNFPVGNGGNGMSAHFIFANLNGTISAWDTGPAAFTQVTTSDAMYTGLAISQNQRQPLLYAANNAGTGSINVFDGSFKPVTLSGTFTEPNLPAGLVPFNVQDINGFVYVTYAPAGRAAQTTAGLGEGAVSVFDENGNFIQRLITGGNLAAPWGIALAPLNFGHFGGDLLIGNFSYSNSFIGAYDPTNGNFKGMIPIELDGNSPGGLWALVFGSMGNNGSPNTLYFTDGINREMDGLFGAINPTPLPAAFPLFATGIGALGLLGWRRKRKARALA